MDCTLNCSYSDIQVPPNSIPLLLFEMSIFCFYFLFFFKEVRNFNFWIKTFWLPKSFKKMLSLTVFIVIKCITLNLPFKYFKVYNSVASSTFTMMCSHQHCLAPKLSIYIPNRSPTTSSHCPSPSSSPSAQHSSAFCLLWFSYYQAFHTNGIIYLCIYELFHSA